MIVKFLDGTEKLVNDLRGADLRGADLRGADLRGANLRRANLEGAYLRGADLSFTTVVTFTLGKHYGYLHEDYLEIGCQGHYLEHWLEHYPRIGKESGYSKKLIEVYGRQIKLLSDMKKEGIL